MGRDKDILLAYSGGIDSNAAVDILRARGYRVHLTTFDLIGDEAMLRSAGEGARRVGAELHIVDARELFEREIIEYFTGEYLAGRTPAPCTRCNSQIKWRLLCQKADELGIRHIATGHYFRIEHHNSHLYVKRAVDHKKDQSYYLWGVGEDVLERTITPMGDRIKEEIKRASPIRKESMGICFLRGAHYSTLLSNIPTGDIVDSKNLVVGQHNGISNYTIGQRRGEGIPEGLRVTRISGEENRVYVGENSELYQSNLEIRDCHFIDIEEVASSQELTIMIRGIGRNPQGYATLALTPRGARITLLEDQAWAPAPGQPVAIYIGERVVGGGILV